MKYRQITYLCIFITFIKEVLCFKLCVVGASSGLGKEIIYQSVLDKNYTVLALTSSNEPLTVPCRVNSFNEIKNQEIFYDPKIFKDNYWNNLANYEYEHLVMTTGAKPFENDYSDVLFKKVLDALPLNCKSISLVSAFGVGSSLKDGNLGIDIMNNWYLKDAYRAKNIQEDLLKNFDTKSKIKIYRPRALSYGKTNIDSKTRQDLAVDILNEIEKND